jgi:hypothetical protein
MEVLMTGFFPLPSRYVEQNPKTPKKAGGGGGS